MIAFKLTLLVLLFLYMLVWTATGLSVLNSYPPAPDGWITRKEALQRTWFALRAGFLWPWILYMKLNRGE